MRAKMSKPDYWRGLDDLSRRAEREAQAILAEAEPHGRECYQVPLGLLAVFDSGTVLADAITAWCERLDGMGWSA